jgi:RNA polymerase sigma-70 factor (ECF subfamily)
LLALRVRRYHEAMAAVDAQTWAAFVGNVAGARADPKTMALLADAIARARAAWPDLVDDEAAFAAVLGARISDASASTEAIADLHVEDLALAFGCAARHPAALRAFERDYASMMIEVATKFAGDGAGADEIVQSVREKLFGVRGEPRIVEYAGRGPLRKWLRVCVRRAGLDHARARGREIATAGDEQLIADLQAGGLDVDYVKRTYGDVFQDAFTAALAGLDTRERNVLRHHLVHGLKVEEIAGMYRVSRRTVTRWIAAARQQMLDTIHRTVQQRLQIPDAELASFLRVIRSRFDVSLGVALARPGGGAGGSS